MAEEDTSCKEGFLNPSAPPQSAPYEEPPPPYPGDTPYLTKQIQYPPHESEPMLPTSAILQASPLEFHPGEYPPSGVQYIPQPPQPNTVVVTTLPPLGAVLNEPSEAEVNTYLCCSIFNFLCCCPFIGLIAVYLSVLSGCLVVSGDTEQARRKALQARTMNGVGIIAGAILIIIIGSFCLGYYVA